MDTLTYTKTFEVYDSGPERWATYHFGDLAFSEYSAWSWRGNEYRVETADNPFDFCPKLPDAVMTLTRWEICDPIPWDPRLAVEWWNTQQPGLLLGLEVKEGGSLWAKVWTGNLEIWGDSHRHCATFLPAQSLENWHDLVLFFNGTMHIHETITMVGPVGMVSELEPWLDMLQGDLDLDVWGEALR